MKLGMGLLKRIAFAAAVALAVPAAAAVGTFAIAIGDAQSAAAQTIEVRGNQRVDADTIRSYFRTTPGERLDAVKIDQALKALYATGLYADVRISQEANRIVVTVVENLTVNRVAFEGNRKVKTEVLAGEVQTKARGALSRPMVQADVQRIVEVYRRQGYFNVRVDPKIIDQPNNRVDLVFEIVEEQKTTIKTINFVGNRAFSDYKLLDVITTIRSNWLSWLSNRDVYDPERVAADQELLRRFYLKNGYADFRILSATVDMDPASKGFALTFTLEEGEQYRFGTIDVVSNIRDADPEALRRQLRVSTGKTYDAEAVEKTVEAMTIELSRYGYAFSQVRPRGDRDVQNRIINIVFVLEQGPRVYVERINVRGNTRTRDWVVRREFDLQEGDAYNRVLIDRAERRLRNLGYFKTVRITNEPGSAPDRVLVNVEVEEQMTVEFSVGGGYSTSDGFIGEASISERNFLGRGHFVRLGGQFGQRVKGAEFSFTEPYFLDTRTAAGFDLFWKQSTRSQYNPVDVQTLGGTLRLGLPLTEEVGLGLRYTAFQRKISADGGLIDGCAPKVGETGAPFPVPDPVACGSSGANYLGTGRRGDPNELSNAYKQQLGTSITSQVGYTLAYNTLDENKNPSRGIIARLNQDFAGLGGDAKFIRTTADVRGYYPITGDLTGMLRAQGGYVVGFGNNAGGGGNLRILDQFFQGPDLVRGFAPAGIGPRDLGSPNQDAVGGTMYWGTTAELIFPFPYTPKEFGLKAAIFADAGSLWGYDSSTNFIGVPGVVAPNSPCPVGSNLKGPAATGMCLADSASVRASVGASVIWASPFGPLRFDFAYPLLKEPWDKKQAFRFGAASGF
jgi:outer membrane protein insertion porin family